VSVAAAVDLDGETIRDLRIVLGGVAHKPWRAHGAEQRLRGHALDALTDDVLAKTGADAVAGAQPHAHNAFKVELAQRAVARALRIVTGSYAAGMAGGKA
jgi:xanthine dehydrogenase YagS FAD-binding subunit